MPHLGPKHHAESIDFEGRCPMCHELAGSRRNRRGSICRYCAHILEALESNDYGALHFRPRDKKAAQ